MRGVRSVLLLAAGLVGTSQAGAWGASISVNDLFNGNSAQVRVGTSATDTLRIQRSGSPGDGAVIGFFPGGTGPFSPSSTLPYSVTANGAGNARTRVYTFTPTSRGVFTTIYSVAASQGGSKTTTFNGQGVGPVYDTATVLDVGSNGLPLLDFGTVNRGKVSSFLLNIRNTTTDGVLGQKTALTLNSISISGLDASDFSLPLFTPGTTISAGQSYNLQIDLSPTAAYGFNLASLLVETDVGAALGGNGADYAYDIRSFVIPEPGSLWLMIGGLAGVLVWKSRSRVAANSAEDRHDKAAGA